MTLTAEELQAIGIELNEEQQKALLEKYQAEVDTTVTGLKAKNIELIQTNKTIKDERDTLKKQFDGIDIEAVKNLIVKSNQDEEGKLIAQGKLDEVVRRRTELMDKDYQKKLKTEMDRANALEAKANKLQEQALANAISSAAIKAGALPEAMEDVILRSKGTFTIDENGEVVAIDRNGEVVYGKDGKSPLSPSEWAEALKETAPHLWPRVVGGGAAGNNNGKATRKWSDYTELERAELARTKPEEFKRLQETKGT